MSQSRYVRFNRETEESTMRLARFSIINAALLAGVLAGCATSVPPMPVGSTPSTASGLHFAVASDFHYGEPGTDYQTGFARAVAALNAADAADPLAFVALNGDLSHGGVALAQQAKAALAGLKPRLLVTPGNHDELTDAEWQQVWGAPADQVVRFGDRSVILANTSNAAGDYVCPNQEWLAAALAAEAGQRDVFVIFHITVKKWTTHGIDCPQTRALLAAAGNVRAVFNGHDHDQVSVKDDDGLRYFFDGHVGGSWGAPEPTYRDVMVTDSGLTTRLITLDGRELSRESLAW
jgi:3',5'-cyclic AMP phosphodiesterase CpdA